jgi:hypothetical protein
MALFMGLRVYKDMQKLFTIILSVTNFAFDASRMLFTEFTLEKRHARHNTYGASRIKSQLPLATKPVYDAVNPQAYRGH